MARDCCHLGPRTHRPGAADEQEDLKTFNSVSTLVSRKAAKNRNLHNACGDLLPMAMVLAQAPCGVPCLMTKLMALGTPCPLTVFLACLVDSSSPETLCRRIEKSHRPGWPIKHRVPGNEDRAAATLSSRIYFLLREQTVTGWRQNCGLTMM